MKAWIRSGAEVAPAKEQPEEHWTAVYGLPEKIWFAWWLIITLGWLFGGRRMPDFSAGLAGNLAMLALIVLLPQITWRIGQLPFDAGRIAISAASAVVGYERSAAFIAAFRTRSFEHEMLLIDKFLFGGNPTEWMQALYTPALSEYLQIIYVTYFPQLLLVGIAILVQRQRRLFYEYVVALNLAIILNHFMYFVVPLRSPFLIAKLGLFPKMLSYSTPLHGLWFFDTLRQALLEATTMRYDCFPSGHTMHSMIAMIFAWRSHRIVGTVESVVAFSIIFSTLYLRYHYAIDLVVGAAFAFVMLGIGSWLTERFYASDPVPQEAVTAKSPATN